MLGCGAMVRPGSVLIDCTCADPPTVKTLTPGLGCGRRPTSRCWRRTAPS